MSGTQAAEIGDDKRKTIPRSVGQDWELTDKGFDLYKTIFGYDIESNTKTEQLDQSLKVNSSSQSNILLVEPNVAVESTSGDFDQQRIEDKLTGKNCATSCISDTLHTYPDILQMVS